MENIQFPDYIQERITDEFLITFKEELEDVFIDDSIKPEHPTYWNYYQWFDRLTGFNKALKSACEIHSLNDLYEYRQSKSLDDINEILGGRLTEMLYERGIIEEGNIDEAYPMPFIYKVPSVYEEVELDEFDDYDDDNLDESEGEV